MHAAVFSLGEVALLHRLFAFLFLVNVFAASNANAVIGAEAAQAITEYVRKAVAAGIDPDQIAQAILTLANDLNDNVTKIIPIIEKFIPPAQQVGAAAVAATGFLDNPIMYYGLYAGAAIVGVVAVSYVTCTWILNPNPKRNVVVRLCKASWRGLKSCCSGLKNMCYGNSDDEDDDEGKCDEDDDEENALVSNGDRAVSPAKIVTRRRAVSLQGHAPETTVVTFGSTNSDVTEYQSVQEDIPVAPAALPIRKHAQRERHRSSLRRPDPPSPAVVVTGIDGWPPSE